MCVAWYHQFNLHTNVVRPFHTYGPGMALDDGRVFADFVADIVNDRDIVLKSDVSAERSFCYIADAAEGFLTVLINGKAGEAYNVANPSAEISIHDLAHALASLVPEHCVGVRVEIPPVGITYVKSLVSQCLPSIDKLNDLGWSPSTEIRKGFAQTIKSYFCH